MRGFFARILLLFLLYAAVPARDTWYYGTRFLR